MLPDINALRASVATDDAPPAMLPPGLQALWLVAKAGGGPSLAAHGALAEANDAATALVSAGQVVPVDGRNLAWVRAHLFRADAAAATAQGERDRLRAAAEHCYSAASRPVPESELREEWVQLATALLGDMLQRGLADGTVAEEAEAAAAAAAGIREPLAYLEAIGMRQIPHGSRQADLTNGTFMDHLQGVEKAMRGWSLAETMCLAGLFHSVYGTQGFGYYTLPLAHRGKVQELIGKRGELAVYYNCVMDRGSFDKLVLSATDVISERPMVLSERVPGVLRARPNPKTGMTGEETFSLTLAELKDLTTLYNADNFDVRSRLVICARDTCH
jgi:hypothetical protein